MYRYVRVCVMGCVNLHGFVKAWGKIWKSITANQWVCIFLGREVMKDDWILCYIFESCKYFTSLYFLTNVISQQITISESVPESTLAHAEPETLQDSPMVEGQA